MLTALPDRPDELIYWTWPEMEPHFRDLAERSLTAANVSEWLKDWSRLAERVAELEHRLYVATTVNTADVGATTRFSAFMDGVFSATRAADQTLKEKLLASGLEPEGFEVPLRIMRAEAALYREANLPLLAADEKLGVEHDAIVGGQTVSPNGEEITLPQLLASVQDAGRAERERAWRLARSRQLQDREAIGELWRRFLQNRRQIAANAGLGGDYRAYRWQQLLRFDYSPADCAGFHNAIEAVVVPAAARIYERGRARLGLETLRPWDLADGWWGRPIDPPGQEALKPFGDVAELETKSSAVFHRVDPQLGAQFDLMRREGLLDLESRKNKAPGAYCEDYPASKRPFILANVAGTHDDVQTVLHEAGHAFHTFERSDLPYYHQTVIGSEIAEVASMAMELLAAPHLTEAQGGFYTAEEAARARVERLENSILFWPFMAVVDGFQHWVYENPAAALDPAECDAHWQGLWQRFMPGVDWSGLEQEQVTGWQRKAHIHQDPFYYVEYGLAQLGAVQVWRNALGDQAGAVAAYRRALALGGSRPLPELFAAAGARFAFDAGTLRQAVDLMEQTIASLDHS